MASVPKQLLRLKLCHWLGNVINGEITFVTSPRVVEHNAYYRQQVADYKQRYACKSGITGLAQVEGWRGETTTLDPWLHASTPTSATNATGASSSTSRS